MHIAQIKDANSSEKVAIKILRPKLKLYLIRKLDALMLLAYLIESIVQNKDQLIEVVHLLREITNIEMDLNLKQQQQMRLYENTKADDGFVVPSYLLGFYIKKS